MPDAPVRPGAEPVSHHGDRRGVLVLHGFTGSPQTMRPVADALVAAGFSVELPRLAGHGTVIDDMLATGWADWSADAQAAFDRLAERTDRQAVVGLSMGGTLTAWIASRNDVAGAVFVNALVRNADPALRTMLEEMVAAGESVAPGVGSDIADPEATEDAYDGTPLVPLMTLFDAIEELQDDLPAITCPALVMVSPQDHVVEPGNADHLAERLGGPVERVTLERSYHVATLDHDRQLIQERVVDFCTKVLGD